MEIRLQKFLSMAGVCSRRAGEKLIESGRVTVNGSRVTAMGVTVDPENDVVEVDGRRVKVQQNNEYILLYKPVGYVTTLKDEFGRPTVKELVADIKTRVYPVGRLDLDTSGLLLLTNDGELANQLTHPSFGVEKEYLAKVHDTPKKEALEILAKGVRLDDGMTAPAKVQLVKSGRLTSVVSLIIKEGRNRQVRRMLEAVGHPVVSLKRVRFGPLTLSGLQEGRWRRLEPREIEQLRRAAGAKR
ncbi:pseudouridine synthase [Dethiobacter alkaliphilus]|uniref:Pseudouridine synthase n=1 Tax=Dethiobacter alkaliphilus AHT 1 TaxID=555088 RepID=C0GDY1_DETAL|nr:pseudouridine synthase [Dethiobacter alkaliphilus]EEG78275.1 pseudouridine synthase [Dethiobacter alkaliphilus AHT 1]